MLDLRDLIEGLPAITPAFGSALAEAGGVCLESEGHLQGDTIVVRGDFRNEHCLAWPSLTEQAIRCWNDPEVATEHGAVGIAVLLAKKEIGFTVVERSRKGTGFDYWMGDTRDEPFQNMARLEISGIRSGDDRIIRARVQQKLKQTNASDGVLPAFVVIVEFGNPVAEVHKK
jgi:hypothetical protein